MGKTVIFGGTFNPPHEAHREMCLAAALLPEAERVLVIPAAVPPHKEINGYFASDEDRLNMCRLMCRDIKKAEVSDTELKRGGKSYTLDTVTELGKKYTELSLLIGGDMLCYFKKWYKYKELLKKCEILCVRRKSDDKEEFKKAENELIKEGARLTVLDADVKNVSSTEIRERFAAGQNADDLLPTAVAEYIREKGLYV